MTRRQDAGTDLLTAIAVVQAHRADDREAYRELLFNNDPTKVVAGLIDLVQLLASVTEPDTGLDVDELLERAFAAEAHGGPPA